MKPELDEPFAERIERLKQELALALRWDRPSILLAIYASEFVRADAEAALEAWLREQGQEVARIQVTKPADADVPLRLREWPNRDRTVFFVSGLRWGAPTSWNALNVRREYLVEDRIRAVFWLTEGEAVELPHRAPDFWAFRHRVVEFVEPPEVGRAVRIAGELAWAGFEERISPEERRARIAFREQLLSELPDTPETATARAQLHYVLGRLYHFGREHETALQHFQAALDLAEQLDDVQLQAWALNGLGAIYRALGRQEETIAACQRAIELDPNTADYHSNLGNVYRDLGRQEEAIAAFQRAIELNPTDAHPHNNLGAVYRDLGRQEEAIAAYQRAIELDPTYAYPHHGLGAVYSDLGRQEEAIAACQRAIELDPNYASPHNGLGNVYRDLGRHEEAIAAYQKSLELQPRATPHNGLGNVYSDLGRHEEAIAAYQRAIELDPTDAYPHHGLGAVYRALGRQEEAIAAYQRAIELDPDYVSPHNNLGAVYSDLGRQEEAIAAYQRAIELDPTLAAPHNNLGLIYSALGRQEEAIGAYQRAIELDPNSATSHVGLAGAYRHIGDADAQAHYAAEARRLLKPDDYGNLACIESIAGNVDVALEHLAKALEQAPGNRLWARRDPDLAFIRDDPRFRELVGDDSAPA